jgi:hypothetical protein
MLCATNGLGYPYTYCCGPRSSAGDWYCRCQVTDLVQPSGRAWHSVSCCSACLPRRLCIPGRPRDDGLNVSPYAVPCMRASRSSRAFLAARDWLHSTCGNTPFGRLPAQRRHCRRGRILRASSGLSCRLRCRCLTAARAAPPTRRWHSSPNAVQTALGLTCRTSSSHAA